MSAFGCKADVNHGPAEDPIISNSRPYDEDLNSEILKKQEGYMGL